MTDVLFSIDAAFDRGLFWEGGGSVRHLVTRVTARRPDDRRPAPAARAPLNIALVIDASGSMAGGKLEAAKAAALGLVERLTEQDRLTVVSFASDVVVHLDAVPVTEANALRIHGAISHLRTRGMTCLSGGWFAGVDCAARIAEADPRMTPRVILLSDGRANEGIVHPGELREHAAELRMRGVLTSALGIGDDYDEQLLRGIAESGGGRLHDAELTAEISAVLLGELDDICDTVVEDVRISVAVPEGARVEVLGRGSPELRDGRLHLSLGPVQEGIPRIAVCRVTCPRAQPGDVLGFELTASGRAAADGSLLEARARPVSLVAADGAANSAQPRDSEVAEIVARAWSAWVVATAARMNRDGAGAEAEAHVRQELHHFRRYVEGLEAAPPLLRDLELLERRVRRRFSPRMRKEMVLQSVLFQESRIDRRGQGKAAWSARLERGE